MKAITKYRTDDGCEFEDQGKAETYERLARLVQDVLVTLAAPPKNDGCSFTNGGGYLQHDLEVIKQVKQRLHKIARGTDEQPGPLHWWIKEQEHKNKDMALDVHPSWPRRMLDGLCSALDRAYYRLCCIDSHGREWGQPYYTSHPEEAKQICLNA